MAAAACCVFGCCCNWLKRSASACQAGIVEAQSCPVPDDEIGKCSHTRECGCDLVRTLQGGAAHIHACFMVTPRPSRSSAQRSTVFMRALLQCVTSSAKLHQHACGLSSSVLVQRQRSNLPAPLKIRVHCTVSQPYVTLCTCLKGFGVGLDICNSVQSVH